MESRASTATVHLESLARRIGARGSTTPEEAEASRYAYSILTAHGLDAHEEPFTSPVTGWRQFFFASLITLLAVGIGTFGGRLGAWLAGVLAAGVTASVLLELYFRPNPLRFMVARGESQNVWARIPPLKEIRRRLLVLGHIDTHRTPWVFETPARLSFFRVISTLGTISFALIAVILILVGVTGADSLRWITIPLIPVLLIGVAMTWQADRTPFTEGANDNGSGAAIVLSLADQLADSPLTHTEVWLLLTGCEEVGSYGAQAFLREHRDELANGDFQAINIDNVGGQGAGVCYITVEGMLIPFRPSGELLSLADRIRLERAGEQIYSKPFTTLHTDGTCLMSNGIPCLSFVGLTPSGILPNWHQVTDTVERTDPTTIQAVDRFVVEMLRRIDIESTPHRN